MEFCTLKVRTMAKKLADGITGHLTRFGDDEILEVRRARSRFQNGSADQASRDSHVFQPFATSGDVTRYRFCICSKPIQCNSSSRPIAPLDIFANSSQIDRLFGRRKI